MSDAPRRPEDLDDDERERVRRAHIRLRKASQDLEAFVAPQKMRGRWDPQAVPEEALDGARRELVEAYRRMWLLHAELLGWAAPAGVER